MQKNLHLNRYHKVVIGLYLLIVPILLTFILPNISYGVSFTNITKVLGIIAFSILCLTIFLFFNNPQKPNLTSRRLLVVTLYALAFAIPEEILFRGFVQGYFYLHFGTIFAVLASSFVFGFAHLFNGASGALPTKWNWRLIILAGLAGLPLGTLFIITGSLFFSTLLHALLLVGLQLFARNGATSVRTKHVLRAHS